MKIYAFLILIIPGLLSFGQKKQVCFSFDDLPVVSYGIADPVFQENLIDKLVSSLKNNKIPAIGFVNESRLYNNQSIIQSQVELLNKWADSGLDLGNHTFSHSDYNNISFKEFSQDILDGETVTKEILKNRNKSIKYFRHPFLHVGNTKAKADSLSNFLYDHGYIAAPVTIDNEDYLFALAYQRAKGKADTNLSKKIGHDYIDYMERKLKYYEMQVNILFGRDINQILLLHASSLNSEYVDSLAYIFRRNNYDFVSMDEALKDDIFRSDITVYGDWGISWIDKWALSRGKKGSFFKDEPATPDYIRKLAE